MKDCFRRFVQLIFATSFFGSAVFGYLPSALAGDTSQHKDRRTIRVTTGIEQVQGWERGLIQSNPNLARWHWDPIYSYKQGYATISPALPKSSNGNTNSTAIGSPGKPAYKYVIPPAKDSRPSHAPFSSQALAEVEARYSQPSKAQLPSNRPVHDEQVSGKLSTKQTSAVISPTSVATYGQPYAREERADTGLKYSAQKASVYGQLLNAKSKPSASKQSGKRSKTQ